MAKPYSMDLRERVVARVVAGETVSAVAAAFDVSVSAVVKWSQRYRATGSAAPAKFGGWRRPILEPHAAFVRARLTSQPGLALRHVQQELAERGVKVSYGALWSFVHALGLSFKINCVRDRAGPPRGGAPTPSMAPLSSPDRARAPRIHR
jgi:putative transposase